MTSPTPAAVERATAEFERRHGRSPSLVVRAPGRVNLIGDHTDYNDGFVLPLALPYATAIAAESVAGTTVTVHSEGFGAQHFDLDDSPTDTDDWGRYLHGMASLLAADGHAVAAWSGTVATDIPAGAGLSSSAALEVAGGLTALAAGAGAEPDPSLWSTVAATGTRVENELLGLPSGIMDQLISAIAPADGALLIDCRDRSGRPVPIPADAWVVVLDTGTRRQLVDSEFAKRRADCALAAKLLGIDTLRDASLDDLDRLAGHPDGSDLLIARARHVLGENARTLAAAHALSEGDLVETGRLMSDSHRSLAVDYDVSSPALDAMVAVAQDGPGCFGARVTGGGFAGCAVALVAAVEVEAFCRHVESAYTAPPEQPATAPTALHPVRPAPGATVTVTVAGAGAGADTGA
ncbi:MAG: galactokinase [Actinomycetota bacterium]